VNLRFWDDQNAYFSQERSGERKLQRENLRLENDPFE
jgi:hypothetical protein